MSMIVHIGCVTAMLIAVLKGIIFATPCTVCPQKKDEPVFISKLLDMPFTGTDTNLECMCKNIVLKV